MHSKRQEIVIALLMTILFVWVSTPWDWGATFFGDSTAAWIIYYIIGFVLAFYTSLVFLRALKILKNHMNHNFKEEEHE